MKAITLLVLLSVSSVVAGGDAASDFRGLSQLKGGDPTELAAADPALAPTPHAAIQFALGMYRGIRPEHTFVDIGCGDGRVLIAAVQKWKCQGLGIEIDPAQAELARRCVESVGLSDRIKIVTGDALTIDIKADAGFAYLYPDTLDALTGQINKIPAFVSYQHPVEGLVATTSEQGTFYSREPVQKSSGPQLTIISPKTWDCSACPGMRNQDWSGFNVTFEKRDGLEAYPCAEWTDASGQVRRLFGLQSPAQVRAAMQPKPQVQQAVVRQQRVGAVWGGRMYSGPVCNSPGCRMCNSIRSQLWGR